jgi:hypothetical protein
MSTLSASSLPVLAPPAPRPHPPRAAESAARAIVGSLFTGLALVGMSLGFLPFLGVLVLIGTVMCLWRPRALVARARRRRVLAARRARTQARMQALEEASAERVRELAHLTLLVDQMEDRGSGLEVGHLELQQLLDRYVQLALATERGLQAARRAELCFPAPRLATESPDPAAARLRDELHRRRVRRAARCRSLAAHLELELAAIVDFITYVDEEIACPDLDPGDPSIGHRLADLDELLDARRQLTEAAAR